MGMSLAWVKEGLVEILLGFEVGWWQCHVEKMRIAEGGLVFREKDIIRQTYNSMLRVYNRYRYSMSHIFWLRLLVPFNVLIILDGSG